MRAKSLCAGAVFAWFLASAAGVQAAGAGSAFTYQGRLQDAGGPITGQVDMRFTLKNDELTGITVISSAIFDGQPGNGPPVDVTDGVFTSALDFGVEVFDGTALWLEIEVRRPHDPTDTALYTTLSPRQAMMPVPCALQTRGIFVDAAGNVGIGTTSPGQKLDVAGNIQAGSSITIGGSAGMERISSTGGLELHTGVGRSLRIEAAQNGNLLAPNVIGGADVNSVAASIIGATIAGGGQNDTNDVSDFPNQIFDDFGAVGGGRDNRAGSNDAVPNHKYATVSGGTSNTAGDFAATVGGGDRNSAGTSHATVAGGFLNSAGGASSSIGGGQSNNAGGSQSTIGGGFLNTASATVSTVVGGEDNTAAGVGATVGGGSGNDATGDYSYAAGRGGQANHDGTFVWADSTFADFTSTGANQFLLRAGGGVGIGTTSPSTALDVAGTVTATGFAGDGSQLSNVIPSGVIVMWSGTIAAIPSGWALCDGTLGTPDLRDRFIFGTSVGEQPGATGGATSHAHASPAHSHTVDPPNETATSSGGHDHTVDPPPLDVGGGSHDHGGLTDAVAATISRGNQAVEAVAAHQHTISTTGSTHTHTVDLPVSTTASNGVHTHDVDIAAFASGSGGANNVSSEDHLPPYFKLAFIMKL